MPWILAFLMLVGLVGCCPQSEPEKVAVQRVYTKPNGKVCIDFTENNNPQMNTVCEGEKVYVKGKQ